VRVGLHKAVAAREPGKVEPASGDPIANAESISSGPDVDDLIGSLVDAVEASDEEEVEPRVELPTEAVRLTAPRRPLIRKLRRAGELVRRDVAFYVVATVALGIAVGLLAGHGLP
jgi:hypothetical protein